MKHLLENEITEALKLSEDAELTLEKELDRAKAGRYRIENLVQQFNLYEAEKKFAHCHFLALMLIKADLEVGRKMMERNSDRHRVSEYHHGWHLISSGNMKNGRKVLQCCANKGHIWAKRDLLVLMRSNSEISIFSYFVRRFFLFFYGLTLTLSDPESAMLKKEF